MPKRSMGISLDTDMPLMITGQNQLTVDELIHWSDHSRDYGPKQRIGEQVQNVIVLVDWHNNGVKRGIPPVGYDGMRAKAA
ncbi:hypothetical protein P5G61_28510 [Paenibacillus sp. F6_3S_P_1C]|uniref:Uncharacterized protein n=1 Tax=Paenibacillus vandeheii TaxID=3035917 RepID=A0ABT8JJ88_9BACL|nr:hypothetical protein [Paenibacillus vandeheii]MDN4605199.1 hypothetical protein [Paenibacillus vandeheii]